MKPWQKGFSLEELDALLPNFEAYNRFSLSPFNSVKRPDVANYLFKEVWTVGSSGTLNHALM